MRAAEQIGERRRRELRTAGDAEGYVQTVRELIRESFGPMPERTPLESRITGVLKRDGGYFLGSSYVNYGFTALSLTVAYIGLHFGAGWSNAILAGPLVAWVILFPLFFFRYARAIWLGMDFYFDATGFEEDVLGGPDDVDSSSG